MDFEVIAIDPDCFYSSEEHDEEDDDDYNDCTEDDNIESMSSQQTQVNEKERKESGKGGSVNKELTSITTKCVSSHLKTGFYNILIKRNTLYK